MDGKQIFHEILVNARVTNVVDFGDVVLLHKLWDPLEITEIIDRHTSKSAGASVGKLTVDCFKLLCRYSEYFPLILRL